MRDARLIAFSETGFTKRYAQWISEELGVEIEDLSRMPKSGFEECKLLVVGAPVHGAELAEGRAIRHMVAKALEDQTRVIVFATGITPASNGYTQRVRGNSGLGDDRISFIYLPGGFDPDLLTQKSKAAMLLYRALLRRQRERTDEMEAQLERTSHRCDFTDQSLIEPLVTEATSYLAV